MNRILSALLCAGGLLAASGAMAQTAASCPAGLDPVAQCYNGQDANGAFYWIAMPKQWNHTLIMHSHGGPRLSAITQDSNIEDLERFAVTVRQGYAWAGSTYRRPGYGVRMAAEDTENLRRIFVARFGQPGRSILHGQSWGGNVAARGIELYGAHYDGLVLTNGMLAGGSRNYMHRADLRAVYQYYCANHPRPDEPQYPLWTGLPADSAMKPQELAARVNECTGVALPAASRSAAQQRKLDDILGVIRIPERTLVSHLNWATFTFRDLTQRVLGGRNPFSNRGVAYHGSHDDAALNRGVPRFDADPQAVADLAHDSDMDGKLNVPAISLHAIDDPTALVEYETEYRNLLKRTGRDAKLVQVFSDEHDHSKLADAEYAAVFDTLSAWLDSGRKPTPDSIAAACVKQSQQFGGGCHIKTDFVPAALSSRVELR
ncbi:hypothetical protein [Janthinobacterium agaricidamnosum]|uniref:Uncharacterized protein n=1 Tax=Janthinobacterium agaricidamnosum NBRC 102515 = DSM 9628 TaxID=1349767 RepID=W0V0G9_9BURK|nr:hypothetical protein [Janthinobacterium agaricidamnosum]CDG81090.1 putative uncharacterized protein [Janthinobacterium agaricidamnosum NBRC 102515 = DSM 9628]